MCFSWMPLWPVRWATHTSFLKSLSIPPLPILDPIHTCCSPKFTGLVSWWVRSPSVIWQKLVAWETSSSVPFLRSQSHCELVRQFFLTSPLVHPSPSLWPRLRPHRLPWAGPAASSFPPCSPCCQTFLPKLRFSRVRFMPGHKTQPWLASPPGLVSRVVVSLCSLTTAGDPSGSWGWEQRTGAPAGGQPWKKGESRALPRAQVLLPKAPPVWGAVSAILLQLLSLTMLLLFPATWKRGAAEAFPAPWLASPPPCPFLTPHAIATAHHLHPGRRQAFFSPLVLLFSFHSHFFHMVSSCLLLTYHLSVTSPSKSLSTCPLVCVPCQIHDRSPVNVWYIHN